MDNPWQTFCNMTSPSSNNAVNGGGKKGITKKSKNSHSIDVVLPRAPFVRTVKHCARTIRGENAPDHIRFTSEAMNILQEDTEKHVISLFRRANVGRAFSNRKTLHSKDFAFARLMRDEATTAEANLEVD